MKATYVTKVSEMVGGLKADPPSGDARKIRDAVLAECARRHNHFVSITFATPYRPRSTGPGSQSAYFHGHVQTIASETGQPADDVKKFIKARAVSRGYPMLTDAEGSPLLDMWGNYQGISEADASVEDEKKLIEEAHQLAAELGIRLIEEAA